MTIVEAHHLSKSYSLITAGDTPVLRDVSVSIEKGEFLALVGPSGAGKSTLLHLLGTIDRADNGTLLMRFSHGEHELSSLSKKQLSTLRNKHIGFVFQFHHLLPEFTALENVMMPLLIAGESFRSARAKALEFVESVAMTHRIDHKPAELSGGEQQRIAIARALVNRPEILYADEPTGNLDSANTGAILSLLKNLRSQHDLTLVIATHSKDIAASAGRVIAMRDGRVEPLNG